MRTLEEQIKNKCIHFTGILNETCKLGIGYDSVKDINMKPYGFPCLNTGGICDKFQFPTPDEVKEKIENINSSGNDAVKIMDTIKHYFRTTGKSSGKIPCPLCSGELYYSIASINGHVAACCKQCDISIRE